MASQASGPFRKYFSRAAKETPGEVWILTGALFGVLGLAGYAGIHKMKTNTEVNVVKEHQKQWMLDEPGKEPKFFEEGRDEDPSFRSWKLKNQNKQYHN